VITRIITYVRGHTLATATFVCLICGLAGASYAASGSAKGRTGAAKSRTSSSVKFSSGTTSGMVNGWAIVGPAGHLVAGFGAPKPVKLRRGVYGVGWGATLAPRCATVATIDLVHSRATERIRMRAKRAVFVAGYAVANTFSKGTGTSRSSGTMVNTFNQDGRPTPLGFDVVVIC
jgi:hypothetical protein